MSKFRSIILIFGLLVIAVAAALLTVLILYATGTLVTDPIELVYSVNSDSKYYDGTPLTVEEYSLISGELLEGHTAQVKVVGSQTNVGTSESTLEVKIFDKKGFDVSDEYAVKVNVGTLTVEKQYISVVIPDSRVIYSGKEVYFNDYEIIEGALAKGHKIAGANAKLLNVGKLPVDVEPVIYDAFDNDVTENYDIDFEMGSVEILPRPITVKPKDISKIYDGTALTATEYEVAEGSLAAGQTAKAIFLTTSGGVASAENCVEERIKIDEGKFIIYADDGTPATDNYDITFESAYLTIEKRPITIATASQTFTYNAEERYDKTIQIFAGSLAPNQIISVTGYATVKDVADGEVDNALTCEITAGGVSVGSNYDITYLTGTLRVTAYNLTVYTKSYTKEYDGKTLGELIDADDANYELRVDLADKFTLITDYSNTVKQRVDAVSETSYKLTTVKVTVAGDNGEEDCTDNFVITVREGKYSITPKVVTVHSPSATFVYNGEEQYVDDANKCEVEGLLSGHKLTLTDYTKVINVSDSGLNIIKCDIVSGTVSVIGNYDVKLSYGTLTVSKKALTIQSPSFTFEYDGEEHTYSEGVKVPGLLDSHDFTIDEESLTTVKDATSGVPNVFTYTITEKGTDVADNYEISFIAGMLSVTPKAATIALNIKLEKEYDGAEYEIDPETAFDLTELNTYDLTVDDFKIVTFSEMKDVAAYNYTAEFTGESLNYNISVGTGTVTIKPKSVNLAYAAKEAIKMTYSGLNNYYSEDDKLIAGLGIAGFADYEVRSAVFSKTLTLITVNSVTVYYDGKDITSNLNINCAGVVIGVEVQQCNFSLTLGTCSSYSATKSEIISCISASGLAAGDTLVITQGDIYIGGSIYMVLNYDIVNGGESVKQYYTPADLNATGQIVYVFI